MGLRSVERLTRGECAARVGFSRYVHAWAGFAEPSNLCSRIGCAQFWAGQGLFALCMSPRNYRDAADRICDAHHVTAASAIRTVNISIEGYA